MNPYKEAWMVEAGMLRPRKAQVSKIEQPPSKGHVGGATVLGGTYVAAGFMIRSGNPAAIAAAAAILAIPDPVIYAVGYWMFD